MENSTVLLETLQKFLRKKCKDLKIITAIVVGVCAFILIIAALFPANGETGEIVSMYVILGLAIIGAIAMTLYAKKELKKYDPENSKLVVALRENNKANYLVWIYPHLTTNTQYGKEVGQAHALVFRSIDDEQYFISLPKKSNYTFLNMLQITLTNITYGYSDSKLDLYAMDPKNLIIKS